MATHRSFSTRYRRSPGGASSWTRTLALAIAAGLAGCGGGGLDTFPSAEGTRIQAAEAQLAGAQTPLVSKPIVGSESVSRAPVDPVPPGSAVEANPALAKPPVTKPPAVPVVSGKVRYGIPGAAILGVGGSLQGSVPFLPEDLWNRDVSQLPVDPMSDALIASVGATLPLQAAFGLTAGVPYTVIGRDQPLQRVRLDGEADREWPVPDDAPVSEDASKRMIVLDRDLGRLYEMRGASRAADGAWLASGGAVWQLDASNAAPLAASPGSSDDAGIPLFAGLLRAEEATAGVIRHALRVTVPWLGGMWQPPAVRALPTAADAQGAVLPPVGMRLRLKPGFVIPDTLSLPARAILQALKTYGMIVVGAGPAWAIEGAPDASWDTNRLMGELALVRGEHFEVVLPAGPNAL